MTLHRHVGLLDQAQLCGGTWTCTCSPAGLLALPSHGGLPYPAGVLGPHSHAELLDPAHKSTRLPEFYRLKYLKYSRHAVFRVKGIIQRFLFIFKGHLQYIIL